MAQLGSLIVTGTSRFLNTTYSPVSMISNALVVGDQTSQTFVAMTPQSSTFQYGTNYLTIAHPVADIYRNAPWITTYQDTSLINTLTGASRIVLQKYSPSNGVYNILTSGVASNTQDETTFTNKAYNLTYNSTNGAFTIGSRKADTTSGSYSLSAGYNNTASGYSTSSLGYSCVSSGDYSFSCGYTCTASSDYTFAGGYMSTASGSEAFAFGSNCTSSGQFSVTFGDACTATNNCSVAIGYECECTGSGSCAEGYHTKASSSFSHAEGYYSETSHSYTHAEGYSGKAKGEASHAEGFRTEASGTAAHSEGYDTVASGAYSHVEGYSNTSNHRSQHVFGEYCVTDPSTASSSNRGTYVEIVGNGDNNTDRSNARTLDWSGNEVLAGNLTLSGTTSDIVLSGTNNTWDGTNTSLKTAVTALVSANYLKKSGGTMTGNLVLGSSAQNTLPTVGLRVHDVRNVAITPGFIERGVNFFFTNESSSTPYTGSTPWAAIIHMKGWKDAYSSWEIAGPAMSGNASNTPLYVRTSNGSSSWGSWRKIYDSGNPPTTSESSIKVKKNISAISDEEVNSILKLNAVKFDFKSSEENNAIHRGFIAEDVAKILPNLVIDEVLDEDGNLVDPARLNYIEMIPYLVEVCKRQQKEIDELKSLIGK